MKPTKKGIQTAPLMDSPYKSTTPYGLTEPLDSCQDPTKCTEVVDTDCVIYTGPEISCQDVTVINTDDTLTEALQGVVEYFCINGGGSVGPQGVQGKTGSQGSTGSAGTPGAQGATGSGAQGAQGTQGVQGVQGLRGIQGYTGDTGLTGSQGSQGVQGVQGKIGNQGATGSGTQGTQGVQGRTGSQGPQGTQGATGAGTPGSPGPQGATGPVGLQGAQGADGVGSSYAKQHAFEAGSPNSFDYQGNATVGTLQSATGWTIYRVVVNAAGSSYIQSATANPGCIWDNYNTYTYL